MKELSPTQNAAFPFRQLEEGFAWLLRGITGTLLITIVLVITWQVLARYLPGVSSPNWTEEMSLMLLVWLGMLAVGLTIRSGETLAVQVVVTRLSSAAQHVVFRFVWLISVCFGAYLIRYGSELVSGTMNQTFSTLPVAVGWMYLALPVGGGIITLYALRNLLSRWKAPEVAEQEVKKPSGNQRSASVLLLIVMVGFLIWLGPASLFSPVGLLTLVFTVLLFLGTPISVAIGMACIVAVMRLGLPELIVAQRIASGITVTPLLAIPFFILVGQLMSEGGIAQRLVDFARILVGPWKGGLAMVNVMDSMLMGGVSGSAVADVSATAGVVIPMMKKKGYDADFATALTVASSVQGVIIPPSHNMVLYSLAAGGVSIGTLFLAGYLPGILVGVSLMIASYIIAVKRNYPTEPRPPFKESMKVVLGAVPSLLVGLVVVGGIVFGWFTATESAAIGVLMALMVSVFFYRELTWQKLWQGITASVLTVSMVMLIIGTASALGWLMAYLQIPAQLSDLILSVSDNKFVLLLLINVLLLLLGTIMDMGPLIIILTPVLLPIVTAAPINMDPVHFGILLMLNLGLGLTTPPVGTALFVGCGIAKISMEKVSRALWYFWPAMFAVLLLVTYVPWVVHVVPDLLGQ